MAGGESLRVLYWTEVFSPYTGGTELLGATLLAGLRERDHEFRIVTSHGALDLPDEDLHDGMVVHRLPFLEAVTRRDPAQLVDVLRRVTILEREFAPELVHVNAVGPSLFFHLQALKSNPIPWVFTPHAPLTNQATGRGTILGEALRSADWIVCLSNAQRESILRLAPASEDRTSVIYCGLEPPAGEPAPPPLDEPRLLCLGRQVRDKGFDVAVSAFAMVAERYPPLRLTMVGDGPEHRALERLAADLGVSGRVDFEGRVPEIMPYLEAATILLMPSRWEETFGLVALEAALMGRPVVAARVGALPEVVQDGETGVLVEREDGPALADAIVGLLERPDETRRMGRLARERALGTFDLGRCLDRYDTLYRRVAARSSPVSGSSRS